PKLSDTLFVDFINRGDATIRFDRKALRGDAEFTLLDGPSLPLTLLPGDSARFSVLYVPGPLGPRQTLFHLEGEGEDFDSLEAAVRVQNDLLHVEVDSALNLGNRACDSSGAGRVKIINRGNVAVQNVEISLRDGSRALLRTDIPDPFDPGDTAF